MRSVTVRTRRETSVLCGFSVSTLPLVWKVCLTLSLSLIHICYYNRGNVSSLLKDYRAALADYDKEIELSPDFAEAYFNRGLTHIFLSSAVKDDSGI